MISASFIVTTWNGLRYSPQAVASALKQHTGLTFEVLFVDDGSSDGTQDFAKTLVKTEARLRYFRHKKNLSTAAAVTTGLKNAQGEYVFLLSDDCVARKDWLARAVFEFERDGKVGIVRGPLLPCSRIPRNFIGHCTVIDHPSKHFGSAAIAYRAEALDKAGRYFRDDLSRYGDDTECALRILEAGYSEVWLEKPVACHKVVVALRTASSSLILSTLKTAWGGWRFARIYKLHPLSKRKFLKLGIFWGGKRRYLSFLFLPVTFLFLLALYLFRRLGLFRLLLFELVLSFALIYGSLRERTLVL